MDGLCLGLEQSADIESSQLALVSRDGQALAGRGPRTLAPITRNEHSRVGVLPPRRGAATLASSAPSANAIHPLGRAAECLFARLPRRLALYFPGIRSLERLIG